MYDQTERELKMLLSRQQYESILHSYDFQTPVVQANVYYDDKAGSVRKKGAMRIRTIDGRHIFTLKIRRDAITQTELEKDIPCADIRDVKDPEVLGWMKENGIPDNTHPFAESVTRRQILETPDAQICLDRTDFSGHVDYEIEYEYKRDHDGIGAFNAFLAPFDLEYKKNAPSKLARAVMYAKDQSL